MGRLKKVLPHKQERNNMATEKTKKENVGILKKLHLIMNDVPYIQKDAKNQHHGYTYASELAIKTALHDAMIKHKVIFQLETLDSRVDAASKATILSCRYKFWDVDSGENLEGVFQSAGPARDDKGLWAATTNAIKYILTSTFLIPTGDDAESETNHPEAYGNGKTPEPQQREPEPRRSVDPAPATKTPDQLAKARFWKELVEKAGREGVELPVHIGGFVKYIQQYMGTGKWDEMTERLADANIGSLKNNFMGSAFDKEYD